MNTPARSATVRALGGLLLGVLILPTLHAWAQAPGDSLFQRRVVPIFVKHCFECHDTPTKNGGLDLARKHDALAGGESGPAIVAGKAKESLLWEMVEKNDMPKKRPSLSADEKEALRQWIDAGAPWSLDVIDALVYEHPDRAATNWIRRLTVSEYIETVRAATGVDISTEARELLPPDVRADGFSNTAYNLTVDFKHVEAYARLAEIIVARMDIPKFAGRFSKNRTISDDDKLRELVAAMGKWLLRGPLEGREINVYSGIATTVGGASGSFDQAVALMVEAMLQSPRFVYRVEKQSGSGAAWKAGPHEIASRMSYILWGAPPDEELMRAADSGALSDRARLEAQVRRMLADPRAVERSRQFAYEWLDLGRLANMRPDPKRFPNWSEQLAADMRDETMAFFQDVAWEQKLPLSALLNAPFTHASPRLAEHYGLKPAGKSSARYDLASTPGRGGILTHGSVLTIGGDDASMVSRGLFVLHELLRGAVKDPPPCVDTTPPPTRPGLSQRALSEARIANTNCKGCHAKFEPPAFGLERFDGIGAYHVVDEHGNKLREDGEILFPGEARPVSYKTSAELMNLLAESPRVRESITWKLTQFALGRPLGPADAVIVQEIHKSAHKDGGTYASTMTAIVLSDLVQMTRREGMEE
jgi:mono/diheme cytochrome c family protein